MQILSGAGSQRARGHLSRRIGACGQKQRHQIGGSAHIGRALAERFTKGRFGPGPITEKSQCLSQIIANFRRVTAKRNGAIEQRCRGAEIPRPQTRHGLIKQRPAIDCCAHPAIA